MKNKVILFLLIFIIFFLEISLLPNLGIFFSWLRLSLVFMVILAFNQSFNWVFIASLVFGLMFDFYSSAAFAYYLLAYYFSALFVSFAMIKGFSHATQLNYYFFCSTSLVVFYFIFLFLGYIFGLSKFFSITELILFVFLNFFIAIISRPLFKNVLKIIK